MIKRSLKTVSISIARYLLGFGLFQTVCDIFLIASFSKTKTIGYCNKIFHFTVPNKLCLWRVNTFFTKEPETLEWINSFQPGSLFLDVGSNIGLYSIFAAKMKDSKVYSFEPSAFNLPILAKNISLNKLHDLITIVPLPLTNHQISENDLTLSTDSFGGALHTFQETYTWDGSRINNSTKYRTIGFSLDYFSELISNIKPRYLKIDVDGIEHLILQGAENTLREIEQIQIEINDNFELQSINCQKILTKAGFSLMYKRHSDMIETSSAGFSYTYNQLWTNDNYIA